MKVSIISVSTLCGRIEPFGIGSAADRLHLEKVRLLTQASLIGAASLRNSDPEMKGPEGVMPGSRIRAIITGSGIIPADRKIFKHGPPPVIFTSEHGYERLPGKVMDVAQVHILGHSDDGMLRLENAVRILDGMGVDHMLIEGGGRLNYSAIRQGIVDEILLTLAPIITGHDAMAMFVSGPEHLGNPFIEFELAECIPDSDSSELFLRYRVKGS